MNNTTLRLFSGRAVDVVPGRTLATLPGWTIDALNVGPFPSSPGYDAHLARTLGSTFDWSDEFRFDKDTLLLETIILKVPERNLNRGDIAAWKECPATPGLLRLREHESFSFDETGARHMAPDGSALICFYEELTSEGHRLRINIAPSLDLLCIDDRHYGWMLSWPAQHLIPDSRGGICSPPYLEDEPEVVPLVWEYQQLVSDDTLDRLNEKDPSLLTALKALREKTGPSGTLPRQALRQRIDALLDTFY
ncbi:hypothetical protein [Myxococcus sp. AM010]|uniref:hypothetical protein n=1 Tax=Myxococcus sp. AM010 TaxID=2745138 RepID=UPI001595CE06|nr:hypothetical protein [Myxococcus sp. AM010]NVJ14289.1 hypothetical protein [Myxococcus sp. AM010]